MIKSITRARSCVKKQSKDNDDEIGPEMVFFTFADDGVYLFQRY